MSCKIIRLVTIHALFGQQFQVILSQSVLFCSLLIDPSIVQPMPCGFWIAGADKSIYGSFVILIIKFYSPCHVANHDLYVSLGLLFCVHADYPVLQPMPCYSS